MLGSFDATCIVVGAIIGVGIFFTPARVVATTGDGGLALTAWIVAGLIALCGALVFAELGSRYHDSGAQYQVLRDAYGPCPAFLFVFCNATAIQAGAVGIIAYICASNLLAIGGADAGQHPVPTLGVSCLLIVSVIAANWVGVKWGSRIQNLTVICKVVTLLVIALLAVVWGREPVLASTDAVLGPAWATITPENAPKRLAPFAALLAALTPAFFAYGGWQHALWISGEIKNPARNLPRAIIGGVLLVVAVYVLMAWSTLRLLGVESVGRSTALAADAAAVVIPRFGRGIIAGAVAVSAFGVLNAQLLSGPRLVYGMARDGRFFAAFARLSRFGTPNAAIMLIGVMALVLLLGSAGSGFMLGESPDKPLDRLLAWTVVIDGVFFAMTAGALIVLRRRTAWGAAPAGRPTDPTSTPASGSPPTHVGRRPWIPVVAGLFILGELGLLAGACLDPSTQSAAVVGAGWIAAAGLIYFLRFRRRSAAA